MYFNAHNREVPDIYQISKAAYIITDLAGSAQLLGVLGVHYSLRHHQLSEGWLLPGAAHHHRGQPTTHQNQLKSPVDAFLLLALKYILLLSKGFESLVVLSCPFESLGDMPLT